MRKNGLRMQKLSQKEDALYSLEKEEKSPKNGKNPYKGKSHRRRVKEVDLIGKGRNP